MQITSGLPKNQRITPVEQEALPAVPCNLPTWIKHNFLNQLQDRKVVKSG